MAQEEWAGRSDTVDRILDGAITALGKRGLRKLSMSDICLAAGISRGTLYRYFNTKDEVLEAIGQHVARGFRDAMRDAVEARPALAQRVEVVLDVIAQQGSTPGSTQMLDVEPGFALSFLRREFPSFVAVVDEALEPVVPRDTRVDAPAVAELVLRLGLCAYLVPSADAEHGTRRVASLCADLLAAKR